MQQSILKFFILLIIWPGFLFANPQNFKKDFYKADTLFQQQKYTQAFKIYDSLYSKHHFYTAQSLLKMAYIKEGLDQYAKALYYLNRYYQTNPNKAVLKKMEKMAEEHDLQGYDYNDSDYIATRYLQYDYWLYTGLLIITGLIFIYLAINYKRNKTLKLAYVITLCIFIIVTYVIINYDKELLFEDKGIAKKDHVIVMSAPSAGSNYINELKKGDRVIIGDQKDIWCKILLNNIDNGWVRKNYFYLIDNKHY